MKRAFLLMLVAALVLITGSAFAQVTVGGIVTTLGPDTPGSKFTQTGTRNLDPDSIYILRCYYTVDAGGVLNIPAGTIIVGDAGSYLLGLVGSQINITGTATNPVNIRSIKAPGTRAPGDWGGLILLGDGPVNKYQQPQTAVFIEGITAPNEAYGKDPDDPTVNPANNAGTLQYLYVSHPGLDLSPNNEINGVTFGGVGTGTTVDYVMVARSRDDGFEWFGGTVNAKHLIVFGARDDQFDTDFGWNGKVQFALSVDDPNLVEVLSGQQSNGFESDGADIVNVWTPFTTPTFSNVTMIGPAYNDGISVPGGNPGYQYWGVSRRGSRQDIHNSILMGFPGNFSLRDSLSRSAFRFDTDGFIKNNTVQSRFLFDGTDTVDLSGVATGDGGWTAGQFDSAFAARNTQLNGAPSLVALASTANLYALDPRATPSTPGVNGVDFSIGSLTDPFFSATTYRGAFDPAASLDAQWGGNFGSWTDFNPDYSLLMFPGWNFVAPTVNLDNTATAATYPDRVGSAFGWDPVGQGYTVDPALDPKLGNWVKYSTPEFKKMIGAATTGSANVTVDVPAAGGWFIIGGLSTGVDFVTVSGASLSGSQFAWDPSIQSYVVVDLANTTPLAGGKLNAGQAAWVKVTGDCTMTLNP